jgi:hypothetical protein
VDSRIRYGRLGVLATAAASLALALTATVKADPPILTRATGTCDPTVGTSTFTASVGGPEEQLDYRISSDSGPADLQFVQGWEQASTFWGVGGNLPWNGTIECGRAPSLVHYEVDWYEPPPAPTSFSGQLAPGQFSDMYFVAPEFADYLLSARTDGEIDRIYGPTATPFPRSGGIDLQSTGGLSGFAIQNDGLSTAQFDVAVAEEVPLLGEHGPWPRGSVSGPISRSFFVVHPGRVTAKIVSRSGETVKTLLDRLESADFSVPWDLTDAAGNSVPDGRYSFSVVAENAAGSADYPWPVTVDRLPPQIEIDPPATPAVFQIKVTDSGSGVDVVHISVDGHTRTVHPTYEPIQGFIGAGKHTISVVATDRAGHSSSASQTFTVGVAKLQRVPCGRSRTKATLRKLRPEISDLLHPGQPSRRDILRQVTVRQALCAQYDGTGFPFGMALLLKQRHGTKTPLLFVVGDGGGVQSPVYTSGKPRITGIAFRGDQLRERRPTPLGTKLVRYRFNGFKLVLIR